jgi:hypothetical protein
MESPSPAKLGRTILVTVCVGVAGLLFLPPFIAGLDRRILSEGDDVIVLAPGGGDQWTVESVNDDGTATLKDENGKLKKWDLKDIRER